MFGFKLFRREARNTVTNERNDRSERGDRNSVTNERYERSEAGASGEGGIRRTFALEVSMSALITAVVVALVALGWVFAFGVIVGRGYSPASSMPELARLMPQTGVSGQENATDGAPEIFRAEDLTFMTDLKQKPGVPLQPTRMSNGTDAGSMPATPGRLARSNATGNATGPGNATIKASASAKALQQPEALFDFVVQIVAYKNSKQADALRERLEGEGMRTRMTIEKAPNGKARWYRVQVVLRGTDADVDVAKERLAALGMKDAKVTSRKAAGRSR